MFFTREPVLETVISARDGCNLVISVLGIDGHEPKVFYVSACEIVKIGGDSFIRASDVLEDFIIHASRCIIMECKISRSYCDNALQYDEPVAPDIDELLYGNEQSEPQYREGGVDDCVHRDNTMADVPTDDAGVNKKSCREGGFRKRIWKKPVGRRKHWGANKQKPRESGDESPNVISDVDG